jgi:hypothetical protein
MNIHLLKKRIMKTIIPTFILVLSLGTSTFSAACPELSGKYRLEGEDGQAAMNIKQMGCSLLEISRDGSYLGKMTRTQLLVKKETYIVGTSWAAVPYQLSIFGLSLAFGRVGVFVNRPID